eukprot:15404225-Alexandrium_andersonii.AAC.1
MRPRDVLLSRLRPRLATSGSAGVPRRLSRALSRGRRGRSAPRSAPTPTRGQLRTTTRTTQPGSVGGRARRGRGAGSCP